MEAVCEICGTKFPTERSHARFCSPKCRVAASRGKSPATENVGEPEDGDGSLPEPTPVPKARKEAHPIWSSPMSKEEVMSRLHRIRGYRAWCLREGLTQHAPDRSYVLARLREVGADPKLAVAFPV